MNRRTHNNNKNQKKHNTKQVRNLNENKLHTQTRKTNNKKIKKTEDAYTVTTNNIALHSF